MADLSLDCRLACASAIAYHIRKDGSGTAHIDPSAPYYDDVGLAGAPACFDRGTDDIDAGFVGTTTDGWVVVALRGTIPPFTWDPDDPTIWTKLTAWIEDWAQDFEIEPTPWTVNGQAYGHVEKGFAAAVLDLWGAGASDGGVQAALQSALGATPAPKGVLVTGHSKGAAATFPMASLIRGAFPSVHVQVTCFAAPLTCDAAFKASYDGAGLGAFTTRYQNEYDLVPFVPYLPASVPLAGALAAADVAAPAALATTAAQVDLASEYVHEIGTLRFIGLDDGWSTGEFWYDVGLADLAGLLYDDRGHEKTALLTVAYAHSLVPNPKAGTYPTGRYLKGACGGAAPSGGS